MELCQNPTDAEVGYAWTRAGLSAAVAGVAAVREFVMQPNDQGARGAYLVVGAGNGGWRGSELSEIGVLDPATGDGVGLMGTAMNASVLASCLKKEGIPHRLLLSPAVSCYAPGLPESTVASPRALAECIDNRDCPVAIWGGGTRPNQTTDSAVFDVAEAYRGYAGEPVRVMKATKHGGVYDGDPAARRSAGDPVPRLLAQVAAATMRERRWTAVDPVCLGLIEATGTPMVVHGFSTLPGDALNGHGTVILPDARAPLVYAA